MSVGLVVQVVVACGPDVSTEPTGGGGTTSSSSTGPGTPDPCETAEGYRVCGGIHDCTTDWKICSSCSLDYSAVHDLGHEIGSCLGTTGQFFSSFVAACPDGGLRFTSGPYCVPQELGPLFCESDEGDLLSFSDRQPYDCSALPEPKTCPATQALELCGDACGPCSDPEFNCFGRSPKHPHSFCYESGSLDCTPQDLCTQSGKACFIFRHDDDPLTQAAADKTGLCMDKASCLAAAAELPGGAYCLE